MIRCTEQAAKVNFFDCVLRMYPWHKCVPVLCTYATFLTR